MTHRFAMWKEKKVNKCNGGWRELRVLRRSMNEYETKSDYM